MKKVMIKEDINFLEYPNWTVSNKTNIYSVIVQKNNGFYEMKSSEGLPSRFDKVVLYYLLHTLFTNYPSILNLEIITTRYEIAKNVLSQEKNFSKEKYSRIMLALKRWKAIYIRFEGVFYEDENYTIKYFSIIDYVSLDKETNKLCIRFNECYFKHLMQNSQRSVDFHEYKKLIRPVSARLYEILIKNFADQAIWCTDIEQLGEQLTLEKRFYPSHILVAIKPAIVDINTLTKLSFEFDYDKKRSLCIFKKNITTQQQQ
jgi:hypothetical protein